MVNLPFIFDARGYEFESAINVLRKGAQAGVAALETEIRALERQLVEHHQRNEFIGEKDKDGRVIWSRDQIIEYKITVANEALAELRKALAVAIYHCWERAAQKWNMQSGTGHHVQKYPDLSEAITRLGYSIHPEMHRVRALVNTIKHNNKTHGDKLMQIWPDVFKKNSGYPNIMDWSASICMTDRTLGELFDVISKSGPNATQIRN